MFEAICDFFYDLYGRLFKSRKVDQAIEPMTERDWFNYNNTVQRIFKAIKPRIRLYVDQTGRIPSMSDIDKMSKEETSMLRWKTDFSEIVICKKLGGYDKYWEANVRTLEPIVTEYANDYMNLVMQRSILSASVHSIVSAQMLAKGIEHNITLHKTQLRLDYKTDKYRKRTVHIYYKKFMQDPDLGKYIDI